ncbi:MAG: hypothetical protein WC052_05290 [Patescibacteria group bacterium]
MKGYALLNDDGSLGAPVKLSAADVTAAAPLDAELDSAFGQPASVGAGFVGIINDAGGGLASMLCWTDGASWYYVIGTKAL